MATVAVEMSTKALAVVNALHDHYSGSVTLNRQRTANQASTVRWSVSGQASACVLWRIAPHLTLKHRQALAVMDTFSRFPAPPKGNRPWTPERIAAWKVARETVMELNSRGADLPVEGAIAQRVGNRWVTRTVDLFGERWGTFSGPWPRSGLMRSGTVSRRPRSGHPTSESGSSCWPTAGQWPTPTRNDSISTTRVNRSDSPGAATRPILAGLVRLWPTPGAADGEKGPVRLPRGNPSLGQATARWATPRANEWKDDSMGSAPVNGYLARQVQLWATPQTDSFRTRGGPRATEAGLSRQALRPAMSGAQSSPSDPTSRRRLNPLFVEWLMGWPIGWTACEPLATEWCRWLLLSRSWLLRLGRT